MPPACVLYRLALTEHSKGEGVRTSLGVVWGGLCYPCRSPGSSGASIGTQLAPCCACREEEEPLGKECHGKDEGQETQVTSGGILIRHKRRYFLQA